VDSFVGQRIPGPDEELSVTENGSLTAKTHAVIELVAEHDAILATGHISPDEIDAVVTACTERGIDVLINHPFFRVPDLPIERQESLAERGATLEYCAYAIGNTPGHSAERVAEAVSRIGPDNCLLASDYGQKGNPPAAGLAEFAISVVEAGLSETVVQRLIRDQPADSLGI
jgi:hypothetical protein